jgi:hypothetical protein
VLDIECLDRIYLNAYAAIPWKRGHFPLAVPCDFGSSSDYRTPVHLC